MNTGTQLAVQMVIGFVFIIMLELIMLSIPQNKLQCKVIAEITNTLLIIYIFYWMYRLSLLF
jgi:hypothetical protein